MKKISKKGHFETKKSSLKIDEIISSNIFHVRSLATSSNVWQYSEENWGKNRDFSTNI